MGQKAESRTQFEQYRQFFQLLVRLRDMGSDLPGIVVEAIDAVQAGLTPPGAPDFIERR